MSCLFWERGATPLTPAVYNKSRLVSADNTLRYRGYPLPHRKGVSRNVGNPFDGKESLIGQVLLTSSHLGGSD